MTESTLHLQVRQRADGGGVVQREQHVRKHDRPAFGSLLARTGIPGRSTNEHARIGRRNARLPIRWFVKSRSVSFADQRFPTDSLFL